jgi:hypothetical protein
MERDFQALQNKWTQDIELRFKYINIIAEQIVHLKRIASENSKTA